VFDFGAGERPAMGPGRERSVERRLEEGWLPVVRHAWETAGIRYVETALATVLGHETAQWESLKGTEPVVAAVRFEMHNPGNSPLAAWLWMEISPSVPPD